jgi:hypothetical protein
MPHDWDHYWGVIWDCKNCGISERWGEEVGPPKNLRTRAPYSSRLRTCEEILAERTMQEVIEE